MARDVLSRHAERHGGVEQPRAIGVHGNAVLPAERVDLRHVIERQDGAARAVVSRFHLDQGRRQLVGFHLGADRLGQDAEIHGPAFTADRAVEQAGDLGDGAHLALEDVRALFQQHFAAAPCMGHQCDEIAHRAAGHEHRRFLAVRAAARASSSATVGSPSREVVAEARCVHGVEHFGRGLGDGVAAQVDHGSHHTEFVAAKQPVDQRHRQHGEDDQHGRRGRGDAGTRAFERLEHDDGHRRPRAAVEDDGG